ncbi:hypothetical protein BV898_01278 [Hypsibius exemplaris]|uniref:tRNA (34-2'-O)-methyltransferase regulator WDR6 n=1 Tax=Hypsibius exemplaris TaxID=2072580 RepID=A0A1W0XC55_HYPEX|nr:hypothetical protein BV898_01278 [Hypsibius exemplaris]
MAAVSESPGAVRPTSPASTVALSNRILAIEVVRTELRRWCILYAELRWLSAIIIDTLDDRLPLKIADVRNGSAGTDGDRLSSSSNYRTAAFLDSNIHGIVVEPDSKSTDNSSASSVEGFLRVCVFGDHSMRLFRLRSSDSTTTDALDQNALVRLNSIVPTSTERLAEDAIMAVKFLSDRHIGALLAHNTFLVYDDVELRLLSKVRCMDSSILYSALLIGSHTGDLVAVGGTVCNYLCFWSPAAAANGVAPAFHKLSGHSGVIFSIDYHHPRRLLCSSSDDRSCRVYHCLFVEDSTASASPSVVQWLGVTFTLQYALYGHEARVWRGRILSQFIVTVGEDTQCCVWSKQGKLIDHWASHTGINTWSVSVVESEQSLLVFTGGADGGLSVREVEVGLTSPSQAILSSSVPPVGKPVRLVVVDEARLIVLAEGGLLFLVEHSDIPSWTLLWEDAALKQTIALRYNPTSQAVAVVTCVGKIALLTTTSNITPNWSFDLAVNCMEGLWADSGTLIVSGPSGFIHIVTTENGLLTLAGSVPLSGKNLWITAAARNPGALLFCGDRSGSLRVLSKRVIWKDIYVGMHVHGNHEVSQITLPEGSSDDSSHPVVTSGRSGAVIFWRYHLNDQDHLILERLRVIEPDNNSVEWVSGFHILHGHGNPNNFDQLIICGFRSTNFAAVHAGSGETVMEVDCGGGHRSFSCALFESSRTLQFAFVKTTGVHWLSRCIGSIGQSRFQLKEPLHGLQIWSVAASSSRTGSLVMAVGSEDTVVKIIRVGMERARLPVSPSVVAECKGHLSSVRSVRLSSKFKNCVYSAGGRTQLVCWACADDIWSENVVMTAEWSPYPVVRKQWSDKSLIDPDTRIMDLSTPVSFENFEILVAGSSDGTIRIFALGSPNEITLVGEIAPYPWCVLQVRLLLVGDQVLVLTAGTKGLIAVFNLTMPLRGTLSKLEDFGETEVFKFDPAGQSSLSVLAHQSGVDALDFVLFDGHLYIATGGDDCSICVFVMEVVSGEPLPILMSKFKMENAHSAQISGIKFLRGTHHLLSASKDQLIKMWEVDYDQKEIKPPGSSSLSISVGDVSCIALVERPATDRAPGDGLSTTTATMTTAEDDSAASTYLAIVGAGFQLLDISSWLAKIQRESPVVLHHGTATSPDLA